MGPLQDGLACFRDPKTPQQEILSNREHYENFSKTEIFTSKSWIFDNNKTLYELKRVQTLLKMIIDHSLALDSSRETKNQVSEN